MSKITIFSCGFQLAFLFVGVAEHKPWQINVALGYFAFIAITLMLERWITAKPEVK